MRILIVVLALVTASSAFAQVQKKRKPVIDMYLHFVNDRELREAGVDETAEEVLLQWRDVIREYNLVGYALFSSLRCLSGP